MKQETYKILIAEMKHANSVKSIFQISADKFLVTLISKYTNEGEVTRVKIVCYSLEHAQREYSNIFF